MPIAIMKFHNRLDTTLKFGNDLIEFKNQSFYRISGMHGNARPQGY